MADEPDIVVDFADEEVVALTSEQQDYADPLNSGFLWYKPPMAAKPEKHAASGHQWAIAGHDMQVLAVTLPEGESVVTEVGTFMFGSPDIKTKVELTLCGRGFTEGCNRICGGESCVKVVLENEGSEGYVGITPNFPAKIIPIQFGKHIPEDQVLIAQPGAYLSHVGEVDVGCDLDVSPVTCCCAGFGCCRQKVTGTRDSIAFLNAGGTILYKDLKPDETVVVDSRSVVAIEQDVTLGITSNGRFCTCLCGGEGCFSTTLTGPGKIFMQSMNFKKFRDAVQQTIIEDRGSKQDDNQDAGLWNS